MRQRKDALGDPAVVSTHNTEKLPSSKPVVAVQLAKDRFRPELGYVVMLVFTFGTYCEHNPTLPVWCWKLFLFVGVLYLGYSLLTFRRWADEYRYVVQFFWCFMAMGTELILENFMVWVVSATDTRRLEFTPALQDNIQLLAEGLAEDNAMVHWALYGRWAHIMHFLGVTLALAFSGVFDQMPYSGFGLMSRVVLTIALSRSIRVVSFWSTVLPSPRPGCFLRRFPRRVPKDWWGFLKVGFMAIRGFGGCNDLVFSGHCGIWTLAPLAFRAYYPSLPVQLLLWVALAQTSLRDVLERQHYSVDMILAVVVTWAVWSWLEHLYPPNTPLPRRRPDAPRDRLSMPVLGLIVFALAVAALIVIVGGA